MDNTYKLPFLALRRDADGDNSFDPTEGEYIINPLEIEITNIVVNLGGYFSDPDVGVVEIEQSDKTIKRVASIAPGSAHCFTVSCLEDYYEYETSWSLTYVAGGKSYSARFAMGKLHRAALEVADIPILGGAGHIVPRVAGDDAALLDTTTH